jgi:hypothetical protein
MRQYFELRFGEKTHRLTGWSSRNAYARVTTVSSAWRATPSCSTCWLTAATEGRSLGGSRALLMQDLAHRQPEALTADPDGARLAAMEALNRLAFAMPQRGEGTGLTRTLAEKTGARLPLKDVLSLAVDATVLEETDITEKGQTLPGYAFYHHLLLEYFAAKRLLTLFRTGEILRHTRVFPGASGNLSFNPCSKASNYPRRRSPAGRKP